MTPIDPKYISEVRTLIAHNFPKRKPAIAPSAYPRKHLQLNEICLVPQGSSLYDDEVGNRYNPYSFRLPYEVQTTRRFFAENIVPPGLASRFSPFHLRQDTANQKFLNFVKEYHLLYLDLLEAINGSPSAVSQIIDKMQGKQMYEHANIYTRLLRQNEDIDLSSMDFRLACLAYLIIDIVRSSEVRIYSKARIHALRLLRRFRNDIHYFDSHIIATCFAKYSRGFRLPCSATDEPVGDLIPPSLMKKAEDNDCVPHNDIFFQNGMIQAMFKIMPGVVGSNEVRMDYDAGWACLFQYHPYEAVQVSLSLMRHHRINDGIRATAFLDLVGLSKSWECEEQGFGAKASYRADIQHGMMLICNSSTDTDISDSVCHFTYRETYSKD